MAFQTRLTCLKRRVEKPLKKPYTACSRGYLTHMARMLLDISLGLFLGKVFNIGFLGIIFSLLPDIDFLFKSKQFSHRGIFHTPIIYILIALLLFISGINTQIIFAFLVGTFFHLFHDLFVIGNGIMPLYPFSKNRLKIFPDNGYDGYLSKKILWWNEKDKEETRKKYNFTENTKKESWIKVWYLRPNIFVITETSLAVLFLFLYFV